MDERLTDEEVDDPQIAETPEDVAILYSWANLHGAKYRDFSASRREYRAQVRHKAAEELRQAELRAQAEAEAAAAQAEWAAREAENAARGAVAGYESPRVPARKRCAGGRRGMLAVHPRSGLRRHGGPSPLRWPRRRRIGEAREIAEAHACPRSGRRRGMRILRRRRRTLAGPQPAPLVPGLTSDPYVTLRRVRGTRGSAVQSNNTQLDYVDRGPRTIGLGEAPPVRGAGRLSAGCGEPCAAAASGGSGRMRLQGFVRRTGRRVKQSRLWRRARGWWSRMSLRRRFGGTVRRARRVGLLLRSG